jgi:8-amino-7-oxononanoate synthase
LFEELRVLEADGLRRRPRVLSGPHGPTVIVDGREVISLSSNDYLGLASHPALIETLERAARSHGVGSGASRLISGTHETHRAAERRLASFVGSEDALLFGSGYAANVGVLSTLLGPQDIVFSDALNHASVIDGCRLSKARVVVFPHADLDALASLLTAHRRGARRAIIATDAIFSMDGDRADLAKLFELSNRHGAWLFVDEAHALGVVGPSGRGLSVALGVTPQIRVGTLGKSFGVSGAFVAGSAALIELLKNRARSFVYSTAPPAALAATVLTATDLVEGADDRRARLLELAGRLRQSLSRAGHVVLGADTPIVPVLSGSPEETMAMSAWLFERGIFAHGIRPPTVPEGTSRIRMVPMATHTEAQMTRVIAAFDARANGHASRATP